MKEEEFYTGETWEDFERQKFIEAGLDPDEVYKKINVVPLTPEEKKRKNIYVLKRTLLYIGAFISSGLIVCVINLCIISIGLLLRLEWVLTLGVLWIYLLLRFMLSKINKKYPKYSNIHKINEGNESSSAPNNEDGSVDRVNNTEAENTISCSSESSNEESPTYKCNAAETASEPNSHNPHVNSEKKPDKKGKQIVITLPAIAINKFALRISCAVFLIIFSLLSVLFVRSTYIKGYVHGYVESRGEILNWSLSHSEDRYESLLKSVTNGYNDNPLDSTSLDEYYLSGAIFICILCVCYIIYSIIQIRKENKKAEE